MARRYEKQTRTPAPVTSEVCIEVTCDLCGSKAQQPDEMGKYDRGGWAEGGYDINHVLIRYDYGSTYPHSGRMVDREQVDVCPECWKTKVAPWFREQGVEIKEVDRW